MLIALLSAFALQGTGCKKQPKAPMERAVNVRVEAAFKAKVQSYIETTGTLRAYERVKVSSETDGVLSGVPVDEGYAVRKGAVLAAIDDRDIKLDIERAEAALRQAEASLGNTKAEYERKKSLYEEKLVTGQQFDDVSARLSIAEAELKKAESSLAISKQKLLKTTVRSPMDGVIEERKVSAGDYARAGTELFSVIQVSPLKLDFSVPEKDMGYLRQGQEVSFLVDAYPGRKFKGKVTMIYPSLDEKTRTLKVEAEAGNPDGLLKPGLYAQVTLYRGGARDAVLMPVTGLIYEGGNIKAFVLKDNAAVERRLKTGQNIRIPEGEFAEVIEGIGEGEQVVVAGQQNLFNGVPVNVAR
ncbi:MAG: efflux RND transporter periplasmic adaptor subunit [Parvibaculum sp.]|uniref:efflux RND transporter periplasmic adaptor subunit n=1 Tax=Parvibaculum sp. TaxID=2024848 RepID=UPI002730015B|nr:efflux RND transporter periplasmic adaptor subunit [Parvibaculum sp.]MDP2151617.1 efflux RND transporter periplasmic adaptor subunit [Parvibaculum sp.]